MILKHTIGLFSQTVELAISLHMESVNVCDKSQVLTSLHMHRVSYRFMFEGIVVTYYSKFKINIAEKQNTHITYYHIILSYHIIISSYHHIIILSYTIN